MGSKIIFLLQLLQVFESHCEYLTLDLFRSFSLPYLTEICNRVKEGVKQKGLPDIPMVRMLIGVHYQGY